ncbi:IclR family transcriptional regulator [Halocatena marina]|uniref:IclR family transcriptional regulator n=1 Tax=Halocatena marina TaxID=2934937 RepID=UPI00200DE72E|nr:IclR family transcriptional regulator [Halocatena marina]
MSDPDVPINSVKRSYDVIDEIREREQVGVTELAEALEIPKSTLHNHLQTLEQLGYLVQQEEKYRLSTKFLHLGREARNSHEVFLYGREKVKRLGEQSDAYCQLVCEENGRGTILLATRWQYEDLPPTAKHVYPMHEYLHTNAPGKAILAQFPEKRIEEIINRHGLPENTDQTITGKDELYRALRSVREQGYAIDRGEMIDGVAGVGASIATTDTVYGAIAAYGPINEIQPNIESEILPTLVKEQAQAVRDDIVFDSLG